MRCDLNIMDWNPGTLNWDLLLQHISNSTFAWRCVSIVLLTVSLSRLLLQCSAEYWAATSNPESTCRLWGYIPQVRRYYRHSPIPAAPSQISTLHLYSIHSTWVGWLKWQVLELGYEQKVAALIPLTRREVGGGKRVGLYLSATVLTPQLGKAGLNLPPLWQNIQSEHT